MLTVFGHPIEHSLSPEIQQAFGQQFGLELTYTKTDVLPEQFAQVLEAFHRQGGLGGNVTVPLKEMAYHLCDELSEEAQLAQAVNTVMWRADKLMGWNTDGLGLVHDIVHNHKQALLGKTILVIGAGGAAKGILGPLCQQQPAKLWVANRTFSKAQALSAYFNHKAVEPLAFEALESFSQPVDIIINATSASLQQLALPIAQTVFEGSFAYDLMYHPSRQTAFTQQALQQGAQKAVDGLGMLVEQGALGFERWFGKRPDTQSVLRRFKKD